MEMYQRFPYLYREGSLLLKEKDIQKALYEAGFLYHTSGAYRWFGSGTDLFSFFDGDPLEIFTGTKSISEIMISKKKRENGRKFLPGYGPKLFALLNHFFYDFGLIEYFWDAFPADVHIQNQCISTGILKIEDEIIDTQIVAERLRKEISEIAREEKICLSEQSHAMWFLGSKLCINCNKHRTRAYALCPIEKECRGRISTKIYHKKGLWRTTEIKHPLFSFEHT